MKAEIIVLGSGTSMGVPTLGCRCAVCTSPDPRNPAHPAVDRHYLEGRRA